MPKPFILPRATPVHSNEAFSVISRNTLHCVTAGPGEATLVLGYRVVDVDEFEFCAFWDGGLLSTGNEDFRSRDFKEVFACYEREMRAYLADDWAVPA